MMSKGEYTELERGATPSNIRGHVAEKRWGVLIRGQPHGKLRPARPAVSSSSTQDTILIPNTCVAGLNEKEREQPHCSSPLRKAE